MAEVFMCTRGQLDDRSKRDLRKVGVVVVEVEDPSQCQFIRSTETVSADDMLWAALDALRVNNGYNDSGKVQREQLAQNLFALVLNQRVEQGKYVRDKAQR